MTQYSKGTRVIAVKAIHRLLGGTVSEGTTGVVTEGGFLNRAQVQFRVEGVWGDDDTVVLDVDDDEVAPA
ncbi:MAG: hypothetical protein J2P43_06835 [Candidatus Dormibacteraeota bacterium]|nr:hypothetical protein [Candidatus Dormibacteraeota bacterium]MBO0744715.1 hypothetical protein [Candidatus Dormibacteraeota bacterium]